MSKLSRFKKAPVIKLPKKLLPQSQSDEDSDDDFRRPIKYNSSSEKSKNRVVYETPSKTPSPVESSISKYFPISEECNAVAACSNSMSSISNNGSKGTFQDPELSTKQQHTDTESRTNVKKVTTSNQRKTKITTEIATAANSEANSEVTQNLEKLPGKVVCPFCWKQLSDKLSGTTHIKTCAKDVPIPRIFEAMQLQEKQIQEWEKLGLDFPGFISSNGNRKTKNLPATSKAKSGGRARNKKKIGTATSDADLELAVALSMSLHEELESRQTVENEFLIENGLEKEIGLVQIKPTSSSNKTAIKPVGITQPPTAPVSRRRGKKLPLDQLPLYSVDSVQKKAIICERVTKILDESENHVNQQFNIRDEIPPRTFGVPKRLVPFQDKDSTLWTLAQGGEDVPNESFSTLELPNLQVDLEITHNKLSEKINASTHMPNDVSSKSNCSSEAVIGVDTDEKHEDTRKLVFGKEDCKPSITETVNKGTNFALLSSSAESSLPKKSQDAISRLPSVIRDITKKLLLRENCDLILYGREEKAIKCHSFMLSARCPKLLQDIVEEKHGKKTRLVVPLTNFRHNTVKAFLWYVYTGKLDESYDEDLMTELKILLSTYGLAIEIDNDPQRNHLVKPQSISVEVQTDVLSLMDSSTMTEALTDCSLETGFESLDDSHESQELFTTILEPSTVVQSMTRIKEETAAKEKNIPLISEHLGGNDLESDDDQSDVDLFGDLENESENNLRDVVILSSQSETDADVENKADISSAVHQEYKHESFDEDDFMKELISPVTQWKRHSEKKRSRSISPIMDNSMNMYSATQVANILQLHCDGGDVTEYMNKANKKLKLDQTNFKVNSDEGDIDVIKGLNLNENDEFDNSIIGDDSIFLKISCSNNIKQSVVSPKTNRLKSRRSTSTPNISVKSSTNSSTTPFYNNQQILDSDDNEPDPFADGCDDSVFANIPEEILSKATRLTPEAVHTKKTYCKDKDVNVSLRSSQIDLSLTPVSHTKRKISPRDLTVCDDLLQKNTKRGHKQGRANGKGKAPPKIKLPSRLQTNNRNNATSDHEFTYENSEREDTFLSQQPPPKPNPLPQPTHGNCKSPLLNYSLIDTPILKQELKKYGIKPLPRSKAKVLLRHIYTETHK